MGRTHPPATKCCHDFAGRNRDEDDELVEAVDVLVIVPMESKEDVDHQRSMACSGGILNPNFFFCQGHVMNPSVRCPCKSEMKHTQCSYCPSSRYDCLFHTDQLD